MPINKPSPWAYDPALTRLPTLSALLGAAYPFNEGSGITTKELVSGQDVTFPTAISAGPGTTPAIFTTIGDPNGHPEYTVAHQYSGVVRIGFVGYQATSYPALAGQKGIFLVAEANGGEALTQAEAEYVTAPATRFALIVSDGGDYSIKPAPWVWTANLLNPIAQAIVAKLSLLAPIWEGSGNTFDLISGQHQLSPVEWGIIDGMACALATTQDSGIVWEVHTSLTDVPYSKIVISSEMRGPGEQWSVLSNGNGMDVSGQAAQAGYATLYTAWSDPLDPTGPSVNSGFVHTGRDYGIGTWAFCFSIKSRTDHGAWAVNGSALMPPLPTTTFDAVSGSPYVHPEYIVLGSIGNTGPSLTNWNPLGGSGPCYLAAQFSRAPFEQEAELITDPANRYILICQNGTDYSVKPATWAWNPDDLDPRIQSYARACVWCVAAWEDIGDQPLDIVSNTPMTAGIGAPGPHIISVDEDGDGVRCLLPTGDNAVNAYAQWNNAVGGVSGAAFSFLVIQGQATTSGDGWHLVSAPQHADFTAYRDDRLLVGRWSEPGSIGSGDPYEMSQNQNPVNYGDGIHSYIASHLDRRTMGPWCVDGASLVGAGTPAIPAPVAWATASDGQVGLTDKDDVDGALVGLSGVPSWAYTPPTTLKPGIVSGRRFTLVLVHALKHFASGAQTDSLHFTECSTDGNQWTWIGTARYDVFPVSGETIEVECGAGSQDASASEYLQYNFKLPSWVFDISTAFIIDRPDKNTCECWAVNLGTGTVEQLEHATDIEESQSGVAEDFDDAVGVDIDQCWIGDGGPAAIIEAIEAFPVPLTAPQRFTLLADPFGPVAQEIISGFILTTDIAIESWSVVNGSINNDISITTITVVNTFIALDATLSAVVTITGTSASSTWTLLSPDPFLHVMRATHVLLVAPRLIVNVGQFGDS